MENEQQYNGQYKLSVEQRLTRLETVVDEIKNNHLNHIETKVDRITWLLVVTCVGLVANFIANFLK